MAKNSESSNNYTCAISSGNDYQPEFLMLFSIIFHFSVKTFDLNSWVVLLVFTFFKIIFSYSSYVIFTNWVYFFFMFHFDVFLALHFLNSCRFEYFLHIQFIFLESRLYFKHTTNLKQGTI